MVWLVPLSIVSFFALLVVADSLERRSSRFLVRSSLRSPLSCEETEAIVAAGLAPCLEANGLGRALLTEDDVDAVLAEEVPSEEALTEGAAVAV